MAIHNEKMEKNFDMVLEGTIATADKYEMDEQIISKEQNPTEPSSWEYVEDGFKISNIMWAISETPTQDQTINPLMGGASTGTHIRR